MSKVSRIAGVGFVAACLCAVPVAPAAADHEDGTYELVAHANWDHGNLSVLVVPPAHGQLFNFESGALNEGDPAELTPFNSYLAAIEAAIAHWDEAIDVFGADWLKAYYEPTVYVLGRDDVPPEVLAEPDILVVTDENEGPSLGTSIWGKTGWVHTPCIVRMSSSWLASFTYADMFNVTAQEYGHCLGLGHVGSQGGVDPTSEQKHPEHDVMNGFYPHSIGDAGTHLHCVSNLDVLAVEHVFDYEMAYSAVLNLGVEGLTIMPTDAYGDTCAPPRDDWRSLTPPPVLPGAPPMQSVIVAPAEGAVVASKDLKRVEGTASVDEGSRSIPHRVFVALASIGSDGGCSWWDEAAGQYVARDCFSPVWAKALEGEGEWTWRGPRGLLPGRYRIVSRVVTEYGNEPIGDQNSVELTVTPARKRGRGAPAS